MQTNRQSPRAKLERFPDYENRRESVTWEKSGHNNIIWLQGTSATDKLLQNSTNSEAPRRPPPIAVVNSAGVLCEKKGDIVFDSPWAVGRGHWRCPKHRRVLVYEQEGGHGASAWATRWREKRKAGLEEFGATINSHRPPITWHWRVESHRIVGSSKCALLSCPVELRQKKLNCLPIDCCHAFLLHH